jgi:hypothetical protein
MSLVQTMNLAKRGRLNKAELYKRMLEASQVFRTVGVSEAQAFAKFCQTDEGIELLAIEKSLPGGDFAPQRETYVNKNAGDGSLWDRLVRATARSQGITYSKAVDVCLSTEEGREAFEMQRRFQKINAHVGFSDIHMEMEDKIADIQKARRRGDPVTPYPSEYETAVNNIRRNYPHLTESEAHDEARRQNPDAWEAHKTTKLGTGKPLPRQAVGEQYAENEGDPPEATSQRTPTPRDPMWVGNQSHAYGGNTPARTPYRPNVEPQIKGWWDRQSPNAQNDYVRILSKLARMSPASAESVLKGL